MSIARVWARRLAGYTVRLTAFGVASPYAESKRKIETEYQMGQFGPGLYRKSWIAYLQSLYSPRRECWVYSNILSCWFSLRRVWTSFCRSSSFSKTVLISPATSTCIGRKSFRCEDGRGAEREREREGKPLACGTASAAQYGGSSRLHVWTAAKSPGTPRECAEQAGARKRTTPGAALRNGACLAEIGLQHPAHGSSSVSHSKLSLKRKSTE